jgi:DNA-binding MarR family transcriptional regulator
MVRAVKGPPRVLQERGYVTRDTDPHDGRRKRLQVTALARDVGEPV